MTVAARIALLGMIVAAAGQWALWSRGAQAVEAELRATREALATGEVSLEPARLAAQAQRALPELAARLPDEARVLLVSGSPLPVQVEHLFLPRPFRLLVRLEPGVFEAAAERWPELEAPIDHARRRMEALELALTTERLAGALREADVLVSFLWTDAAAQAAVAATAREGRPALRLERLDGNAWATVFRIERDG